MNKNIAIYKLTALLFSLVLIGATFALWTPDKPLAFLEAKYLRAPTDLRQVLGIRLHVRDSGPRSAPAVLMLHGFGSSLQTWEFWANDFSRDMRVVTLDLPGSGLSEPDPSGDYTDARAIAIILALMDQLGIEKTSLIGNSIGGRIAWTFAARHPQRVRKLILVSPDGFASPGFEYGKAPEVPAFLGLLRYCLPSWVLNMNLVAAYANPDALTPERKERYHDLMLAPGSRTALLARMEQTVLVNPVPMLRTIKAPTLLLWGRQDGMIPFANAQEYLHAIDGSRLAQLDGVGHLPQEEAPAKSAAIVRAFLTEPFAA